MNRIAFPSHLLAVLIGLHICSEPGRVAGYINVHLGTSPGTKEVSRERRRYSGAPDSRESANVAERACKTMGTASDFTARSQLLERKDPKFCSHEAHVIIGSSKSQQHSRPYISAAGRDAALVAM